MNFTRISKFFRDWVINLGALQNTEVDSSVGTDLPSYSPDIKHFDFFRWDTVKNKIFEKLLEDQAMFNDGIKEIIQAISEENISAAI